MGYPILGESCQCFIGFLLGDNLKSTKLIVLMSIILFAAFSFVVACGGSDTVTDTHTTDGDVTLPTDEETDAVLTETDDTVPTSEVADETTPEDVSTSEPSEGSEGTEAGASEPSEVEGSDSSGSDPEGIEVEEVEGSTPDATEDMEESVEEE